MLNQTIPGGVYKRPDGSYVDADGQLVDKGVVAEHEKLQGEQAQQMAAQERALRLRSPDPLTILSELALTRESVPAAPEKKADAK